MTLSTIMISLLLAGAVVAIVRKLRRDRKNGRSSCGCGCTNCPGSAHCHPTNSTQS